MARISVDQRDDLLSFEKRRKRKKRSLQVNTTSSHHQDCFLDWVGYYIAQE